MITVVQNIVIHLREIYMLTISRDSLNSFLTYRARAVAISLCPEPRFRAMASALAFTVEML